MAVPRRRRAGFDSAEADRPRAPEEVFLGFAERFLTEETEAEGSVAP
ncbi:hypothetical protein [Carbonactinospora thermoautotrophica]|nr:hypothetical protein [Carbonactinospora thermoautotrophica]